MLPWSLEGVRLVDSFVDTDLHLMNSPQNNDKVLPATSLGPDWEILQVLASTGQHWV